MSMQAVLTAGILATAAPVIMPATPVRAQACAEIVDTLKKLLKEHAISEDEEKRQEAEVQKATDQTIQEIDASLAAKEKEIMQV